MNISIVKTRIMRELSNSADNTLSLNTLKKVIGANIPSDEFETIISEMQDEKTVEWHESGSDFYISLIK